MKQIPEKESILRLAFFGTPADNEQYLKRRAILREMVDDFYKQRTPALSYVSQPPLNSPLTLEVHSYAPGEEDVLSYKRYEGYPYVMLKNNAGRFLYAGGFQSDIIFETVEVQSKEVFRIIDGLLDLEDIPINHIIRQWNYIEDITGFQGPNQNYQSFNNGRSEFYGQTSWTNGYPSATGIGTNLGGIVVDFDAAVFTSPNAFATPIDNKLQIAAHSYSRKVLKDAQDRKSTPKFERAKSMTFGDRRFIYISGTAAIRGEESLKGVGLEKQLRTTMENIAQLTGDAQLKILRIYLKNKHDYPLAVKLMEGYNLSIPVSYMCAGVCRDELLVEIEGIAVE